MKKPHYFISLLFTITFAVGGIISLIPYEGASFKSLLGYKAICTFNPASALFCFLAAGISCFFRSTFFKYESGTVSEKIKKHLHSLIPLIIILILALASTFWFINIQQRYTDGTSQATEIINEK